MFRVEAGTNAGGLAARLRRPFAAPPVASAEPVAAPGARARPAGVARVTADGFAVSATRAQGFRWIAVGS